MEQHHINARRERAARLGRLEQARVALAMQISASRKKIEESRALLARLTVMQAKDP
jgi:hypothetical protein